MCPSTTADAAAADAAADAIGAVTLADLEDDDALWDDERHETIRCKWVADGSRTLDEVIEKLEDFIETIRNHQRLGYELVAEMTDDYGHMWRHDRAPGAAGAAVKEDGSETESE